MNASLVVSQLLEMNVLNVQDIDRELQRLAAQLRNPVAARWLTRVARYALTNADLLTEPAPLEPKPHLHTAGIHGTQHPFEPVEPEKVPPTLSKELLTAVHQPGAHGEKRPSWWSQKEPPTGSKYPPSVKPRSREEIEKAVEKTGEIPITPEDWERWHSPAYRAVREATEDPEIQQDIEKYGTMSNYLKQHGTQLHRPHWEKVLGREFAPYTTKTAPKTDMYGSPPTKAQVKKDPQLQWIAKREKEQPVHYFDPTQVRKGRTLWKDMQSIVWYLNYLSKMDAKKAKVDAGEVQYEDAEEEQDAKEASEVFHRLGLMQTTDIGGFRDILGRANDFMARVPGMMYKKSVRVVARHGDLTLKRIEGKEAMLGLTGRTTKWAENNHDGIPTWCTKNELNANSYAERQQKTSNMADSALWLIEKEGENYVLIDFPTHQFYNVYNRPITEPIIREIAPLFANPAQWPLAELKRGYPPLAQAVAEYRQRTGQPA